MSPREAGTEKEGTGTTFRPSPEGLDIVLVSPHGLIRGRDLELGRDPDTGGQTLYVVELARALAADPRVGRVELVTRRVEDPRIDRSYAEPFETLAERARIVRLDAGPRRYLRKESLWPHLDLFADRLLAHLERGRRLPHLLHGHYADGGYVGSILEGLLGTPLVHTGHSLGRVKRARLLESGLTPEEIEERFRMTRRIEAEETTLDHAALVVASTRQEVEEQYALYENSRPRRIAVIPPGVDLARFRPPRPGEPAPAIAAEIDRFLRDPGKPLVLALARADPRKNLVALVEAFGRRPRLRELANLAIVAGTRDDIDEMKREPRQELRRLLVAIDRHDLYGAVAYPKRHAAEDVPELYRLAARRGGVFVNPALTEPFGLTLIEAAASGLPVVATQDGGPRDILAACGHGELVDPTDPDAIGAALERVLADRELWRARSRAGVEGATRHYRWSAHVDRYLARVAELVPERPARPSARPLAARERLLVTDIDGTLLGDRDSLVALLEELDRLGWGLGVATGRNLESTRRVLASWDVPPPELWITSVGAEIHYGPNPAPDRLWSRHLDYRWRPDEIRALVLDRFADRLVLQPEAAQHRHKISFDVLGGGAGGKPPKLGEIRRVLRTNGLHARLVFSHGLHLDVLPIRCSKGHAVRWVAQRIGVSLESIVVAGDSGNDRDMLVGAMPGIVVGNHAAELADLAHHEQPLVYFARAPHAAGILEGLRAFARLGENGPDQPAEAPAAAETSAPAPA